MRGLRNSQFVAASGNQLRELCERRLEDLHLVVLMIDGIHFGGQVLVVALGIAEGGEKHILGVWQGATENTTVVKGLLEDLVDRGLDLGRRYLVVIDGSKALRAGVERVSGEQVEVQPCQIHKRRNVREYLPENGQRDYDRRMRNAYAMNSHTEAKAAPEKIFRQLERINDLGMRKLGPTAAEELLEIVMRRYERASTLVTSNRPIEDWGKLLGDTAAVTAMLDRLLHHGHILKCGPRSWRTRSQTEPPAPEKQ